jgi:hypothetical protein
MGRATGYLPNGDMLGDLGDASKAQQALKSEQHPRGQARQAEERI